MWPSAIASGCEASRPTRRWPAIPQLRVVAPTDVRARAPLLDTGDRRRSAPDQSPAERVLRLYLGARRDEQRRLSSRRSLLPQPSEGSAQAGATQMGVLRLHRGRCRHRARRLLLAAEERLCVGGGSSRLESRRRRISRTRIRRQDAGRKRATAHTRSQRSREAAGDDGGFPARMRVAVSCVITCGQTTALRLRNVLIALGSRVSMSVADARASVCVSMTVTSQITCVRLGYIQL